MRHAPRPVSRVTARWYAAAALLAVAAAALVLWQLETSDSTACFRSAVDLAEDSKIDLEGCSEDAATAVRDNLAERTSAETADEPSPLEARASLVVWMALFAATAGLAAVAGVRSVATIRELRPRPTWQLAALSLGAIAVLAFPFILFLVLAELVNFEFGAFDRLHLDEIRRINPVIAVLTAPAVIGLVVVGYVVSTRPGLGLDELASLGSRMHRLVGMLGAILAVAVLTTAARWQAIDMLPGGESLPSTAVLVWGAVFALVLAVLYLPVYQLWATATEREIAEEVKRQLPNQALGGTAGFRAPELALKKELDATLGVGGALRSLQGSVAVLAPVIAAAVSSLFA
jgi:hypothetical protein